MSGLPILNGVNDFSWSACGLNPTKMKIAFVDDNMYQKLTAAPNDYNSVICAYPYTGPLSIQNNKNFCEDGYEPSIWTNPNLKNVMALGSYVNTYQTMIDKSNTDPGKPVWCVKRVKRDSNNQWPDK